MFVFKEWFIAALFILGYNYLKMSEERFEVIITLHNGNLRKFIYNDSKENVEDTVSKMWYAGFLDVNPNNPKRKIHIQPEEIRHIQIGSVEG